MINNLQQKYIISLTQKCFTLTWIQLPTLTVYPKLDQCKIFSNTPATREYWLTINSDICFVWWVKLRYHEDIFTFLFTLLPYLEYAYWLEYLFLFQAFFFVTRQLLANSTYIKFHPYSSQKQQKDGDITWHAGSSIRGIERQNFTRKRLKYSNDGDDRIFKFKFKFNLFKKNIRRTEPIISFYCHTHTKIRRQVKINIHKINNIYN